MSAQTDDYGNGAVRRLSSNRGVISTAVGTFASPSGPLPFRRAVNVTALCALPLSPFEMTAGGSDAVRLFVGDTNGVHECDLARGQLRSWRMTAVVTGLAVVDDGARLFVVCASSIFALDTRTEAVTVLLSADREEPSMRSGAVVDSAAGALLMADMRKCCVVRLCGIHPS